MKFVKLASPEDAVRLQHLLERCSDFYELHEGRSTPADAGAHELTDVPPGWPETGVRVFALEDDGGALHAFAQLLRDYPKPGTWCIGLLVVAPELRGRGIGSVLLRQATEAAAAEEATEFRLAVSVNNPRGENFWKTAGFREAGPLQTVTARNGHVETVRVLTRPA